MVLRDGKGLSAFFDPESVAILGSFREWGGHGTGVVQNLLNLGFKGRIRPISRSGGEIMGMKTYPAIGEVEDRVDLAVVITPSAVVPDVVQECAECGVRAAVVVSEHFAEAGEDGARLQGQLMEVSRRTDLRIMGPNTIGVLNAANGLVTNPYRFDSRSVRKGGVAYSSQTGVAAAQCQPLEDRGHGISKMCDIGNKCDVDEADVLDYLADDRETKVVAMHLEDVRDGRKFMDAARRLTTRKPLLVLKSGRSEAGARASASHTGSLTGNDQVYDYAFRQVGAIRVGTWQEYWDIPKILASAPLPEGNRVAIITYSGGAGVVAADAAMDAGLVIPGFSPATIDKLTSLSPRSAGNPIDLGPILSSAYEAGPIQEEAIAAVVNDDNIDCAAIGMYVGPLAPVEYLTDLVDNFMSRITKPMTFWIYGPKLAIVEEAARQLEARGLPTYTELEVAVRALGAAARYAEFRRGLEKLPS
jgi:acyl-CoA synthetase (NDP forming)